MGQCEMNGKGADIFQAILSLLRLLAPVGAAGATGASTIEEGQK